MTAGYDPTYGVCSPKRAIQRELENVSAIAILCGEFNDGDQVSVDDDEDGHLVDLLRE